MEFNTERKGAVMPTVRPISDLQRNMGEIARECAETKKPIYLTKNGTASLVVMDAAAFDSGFSFFDRMRAQEMRVYEGIMRGYEEYLNGNVVKADEAMARIRAAKGWAQQ